MRPRSKGTQRSVVSEIRHKSLMPVGTGQACPHLEASRWIGGRRRGGPHLEVPQRVGHVRTIGRGPRAEETQRDPASSGLLRVRWDPAGSRGSATPPQYLRCRAREGCRGWGGSAARSSSWALRGGGGPAEEEPAPARRDGYIEVAAAHRVELLVARRGLGSSLARSRALLARSRWEGRDGCGPRREGRERREGEAAPGREGGVVPVERKRGGPAWGVCVVGGEGEGEKERVFVYSLLKMASFWVRDLLLCVTQTIE